MKYGVTIFPTDYSMPMPDLARAAEERGFESLWVSEHSPIPLSRRSPFPLGGELPKPYYDTLDPFVALSAAAAVTERIRLGTAICLVVQRDPLHTAKEVSSLDQISRGRFLFGVGGGWNEEEMENHGTHPRTRFALMRERIEAMQQIWTQSKPEYHGAHVDFDPIMTWPKPVQRPHPPIHVGGAFPGAARRAIRYGQGWIPLGAPDDRIEESIPAFRRLAEEAGRDPASLEVSIFGVAGRPSVVERYQEAGADRLTFWLPPEPAESLLPLLDDLAELSN